MTCRRKNVGRWTHHTDVSCYTLSMDVRCDNPPPHMKEYHSKQSKHESILKGEIWTREGDNRTYVGFTTKHLPGMSTSGCMEWEEFFDTLTEAKRFVEKKIREYIKRYKLEVITQRE